MPFPIDKISANYLKRIIKERERRLCDYSIGNYTLKIPSPHYQNTVTTTMAGKKIQENSHVDRS